MRNAGMIDGEYTIKRLYRKAGRIELHAANPAFKPICFNTHRAPLFGATFFLH